MNIAFVEDAENDVNSDQRGEDEDGFICQGFEKGRAVP